MAKITTTLSITQGDVKASIDEDNFLSFMATGFFRDDAEIVMQKIQDIEAVLEALKKHLTDTH